MSLIFRKNSWHFTFIDLFAGIVRRPCSRERLRLQGFPESFKIVVSHSEKKQTGSSVPVPVVRAVAKQMLEALNNREVAATQLECLS
jgi:DNA (cytosine-5)-methyltransferase 1